MSDEQIPRVIASSLIHVSYENETFTMKQAV